MGLIPDLHTHYFGPAFRMVKTLTLVTRTLVICAVVFSLGSSTRIRVRREMISLWIAPGAVHAIRSALTLPTVAESNGWMPGVACGFRISPRVRTALVVGIHKLGACCAGPDEAVGAVLARAGIDPLMIAYSNRAA